MYLYKIPYKYVKNNLMLFKILIFRFNVEDNVALVKFMRPLGSGKFISLLFIYFTLIIQ